MSDSPDSYHDIPYESVAYEQCHPDRIATMAILCGLEPPPVDNCRVLDVGCATGGNIIPMADALPNCNFVGIDLSERQIQMGQAAVTRLHLNNIELLSMNLMEVARDFGTFDYIIAHGVFSWVPPDAQEHLLHICARNLSANGIAYVSYNTYPGWNLRRTVREMLKHHSDYFREPAQKVTQARRFLNVMTTAVSRRTDPYSRFMHAELQRLSGLDDSYLTHEHLDETNDPIYFADFAKRAANSGLQYVCDAEPAITMPADIELGVDDEFKRMATDVIHLEQCRDFLQNQMFRRSLLCHADIPASPRIDVRQLKSFYVSSALTPITSKPNAQLSVSESFTSADGRQFNTTDGIVKAALRHLADIQPAGETVERLCAAAQDRIGNTGSLETSEANLQRLITSLVALWTDKFGPLIDILHSQPRCTTKESDRPTASAVARLQANDGNSVTNRRHQMIGIDDFHRHLLMLLDGTRSVRQIVAELKALQDSGAYQLGTCEEQFLTNPEEFVGQRLGDMTASALLIS